MKKYIQNINWKLILGFCFAFLLLGASTSSVHWPIYRGGPKLQGYSGSQIPIELQEKWVFKTGAEIKSSPVNSAGKVVITSTDGLVYCLSAKTGKLLWKYDTKNAIEASATIFDKKVYIGNLSGEVFALDLNTGKKVWTYETDNQIMGAPNFYTNEDGEKFVLIGSYDYNLYSLNADSGRYVWHYELDNYLNGTPSIADGKALFGGCDGFLHIVDLATGKSEKKHKISTYIAGSPATYSGMTYLGDYDGNFFGINIEEQKISWQWKNGDANIAFVASPAVYQTRVVNSSRDKHTYCWDYKSGELLWKRNSGYRIDASPVVSKDRVLTVNMRGDIQVLKLTDGTVLGTYDVGSPVPSNPSVYQEKIYLGAMDGNVYCLGK